MKTESEALLCNDTTLTDRTPTWEGIETSIGEGGGGGKGEGTHCSGLKSRVKNQIWVNGGAGGVEGVKGVEKSSTMSFL